MQPYLVLFPSYSEIMAENCYFFRIYMYLTYIVKALRGFPLELCNAGQAQETINDEVMAIRPRKKFDEIFSSFDTIHECDGGTDRRTPDDS